MVLGLDETQKRFTSRHNQSHASKLNCTSLVRRGYPLFHSREHGWIYRVPSSISETSKHGSSLTFSNPADSTLADLVLHHGFSFHKLPHKDGEKANVGSPLGKTFVKYAADGVLTSLGGEAKEALELNAVCSYWMSSRDRIMNQMVVWEGDGRRLGTWRTRTTSGALSSLKSLPWPPSLAARLKRLG